MFGYSYFILVAAVVLAASAAVCALRGGSGHPMVGKVTRSGALVWGVAGLGYVTAIGLLAAGIIGGAVAAAFVGLAFSGGGWYLTSQDIPRT